MYILFYPLAIHPRFPPSPVRPRVCLLVPGPIRGCGCSEYCVEGIDWLRRWHLLLVVGILWSGGLGWTALHCTGLDESCSWVVRVSTHDRRQHGYPVTPSEYCGRFQSPHLLKGKPPFDGRRPHGFFAGIVGRGWETGYTCKTHRCPACSTLDITDRKQTNQSPQPRPKTVDYLSFVLRSAFLI